MLSRRGPKRSRGLVGRLHPSRERARHRHGTLLRAPEGRPGVAQTWQITPFSSAYIEVATIWITAQPTAAAFGHHGCVAGAQAVVSTTAR